MLRVTLIAAGILAYLTFCTAELHGQGKGKSVWRSPSRVVEDFFNPRPSQPRTVWTDPHNHTVYTPPHTHTLRGGLTDAVYGRDPSDPRERQLVAEQRKLHQGLEVAQHLRDISAQNGDAQLLTMADRLEQTVLQHYQQRVAQLGGQQRPTLAPDAPTPVNSAPESVIIRQRSITSPAAAP
jgi:hypothetical protein